MVVIGIIVLGMGVFYQQQVTNAAREAARYAAVRSATARCPVTGSYDPASPPTTYPLGTPVGGCDRKVNRWPLTTTAARDAVFAINRASLNIALCWSGYRKDSPTGAMDAPPPDHPLLVGATSVFVQCSIDGRDPVVETGQIGCSSSLPTTDQASSMSDAPATPVANTVTAYACYVWQPPMAGFLLIPPSMTLRAAITEPIQRQQ
jgi:hypothetical protein